MVTLQAPTSQQYQYKFYNIWKTNKWPVNLPSKNVFSRSACICSFALYVCTNVQNTFRNAHPAIIILWHNRFRCGDPQRGWPPKDAIITSPTKPASLHLPRTDLVEVASPDCLSQHYSTTSSTYIFLMLRNYVIILESTLPGKVGHSCVSETQSLVLMPGQIGRASCRERV